MATLEQLTQSPVILDVFSRIRSPMSRFSRFMGVQPGGPNTVPNPGRTFSYDIFDATRKMAGFRAPGAPAATTSANPVGNVSGKVCRIYEKVPIPYERIFNMRGLGSPNGTVDKAGVNYITKQEQYLAMKLQNTREFMVSRALRGAFGILSSGDEWKPVEAAGGDYDVDFRIPAANKSKLNMLGTGDILATSWDDAAAPIYNDLNEINAAFENLHGYPLEHVWCSSAVWSYVLANTQVKALAGTSNTPFATYDRISETGQDGMRINQFEAVLRGVPWITWHIYDGVLEVNGTNTKLIDDTHAIFMPTPDSSWFEMIEGSEPVVEYDTAPMNEVYGLYAWAKTISDPASLMLYALDNCIPCLKIPKCVAYGLVKY